MDRITLALTSAALMRTATTAAAEETEPPPLLIPDPAFPFQAEAIAEAGLAQLPPIIRTLVITDTLDPVTGEPIATKINSFNGRVVDVCELLAR